MDRLTKTTITCKIMLYPKLQKEVAEQIADISEKTKCAGSSGGKNSAKKRSGWDDALIGIMSMDDYLWIESIEAAVKYFKERDRNEVVTAVEELYWRGKLNAEGIARKMYISRATVYNLVNVFMETVHIFALKNGLILNV